MKSLLLLLSFFTTISIHAQTWNLPARNVNAMNGTQFVAAITGLGFSARETLIEQEILAGNVPSFYRTLQSVTSSASISGTPQAVTYYVTPDYLAVGTDSNYFLCPMSPIVATHIGDATGCTLPTRKMVNDIYTAATVKLTPQTIPASGQMTTVPVFDQHNTMVLGHRSDATWGSHPFGELTGGDKKDVVISNSIYTTANRVVIYGWHQAVGSPIQPMSNVHSDTYMDYSHGIRLIQNAVSYNGTATTIQAILQSGTLYPLLSDEGVISNPQYPYSSAVTSLATPVSFGVKNNGNNTLSILVSNDNNATHYKVYTSADGINFNAPQTLLKTNLTLAALPTGQICFVKIAAFNQPNSITSATSELLAAVPCSWQDSVLIVNAFDRASAGNTYNFVIQHGTAIKNKGYGFSCCTNEAIQNNIFNFTTYKAVDWISGEESTVNETFSTAEQNKVSSFLQQGGYLFASGSEIGWDLDQMGSAGDKAFYNNYLKASYLLDAPNNQSSTWYAATEDPSGIFGLYDTLRFDNGTHGTYNVDYPDVVDTINGSSPALLYTANAEIAALSFKGIFNGGTDTGKVVYMAFPFETIYPATMRDTVMEQVLDFFFAADLQTTGLLSSQKNKLAEIRLYPNPANEFITLLTKENLHDVRVLNAFGALQIEIIDYIANTPIDIQQLPAGIYFVQIKQFSRLSYLKFIKP